MEARLTGTVWTLGKGRYKLVVNLAAIREQDGTLRHPRTTHTITASGIKAARSALADWLGELEQQHCVDPRRITVGEILIRWLERDAKITTRPKTYERYCQLVDDHLRPGLGSIVVAQLQPSDWSLYHSRCRASGRLKEGAGGLSEQTCAHLFHVLHRALSWAVEEQLIEQNPLTRVRKAARPSPARRRPATWSDEQILKAIDLAYANGKPTLVYVPAVLAAWAGLRRGEICGLTWADVRWDEQAIVVKTSVEQTAGVQLHDLPPKSEAGYRIVLAPSAVFDALREHRAQQDAMRLAHGKRWNDRDRVVCRADGSPMPPNVISNRWSEWSKRRGLEPYVSFHGLRHSYATGLYDAGARTKTVQNRLGHSTPAITEDIYIHGTDSADRVVLKIQEQRIAAAQTARESHSRRTSVASLDEARAKKSCK